MKEYKCPKCNSKNLFVKKVGNNTGLYCGDCGAWIKWVGKNELRAFEYLTKQKHVDERECIGCVLDNRNNKCNTDLCNIRNWKNNIDELLEIAKVEKWTVPTPEEKAIENIEKFIENPDRAALNDEFVDALKLAVEKLEEVK